MKHKPYTKEDMLQVLNKEQIDPVLTVFNRLEARPRTHNFDRALSAEVRDAMWMLTRQWQMGEFKGDDAGSPVTSKIYMEKTMLTKYQASQGDVEAYDDSVPLEAKVEQRKISFVAGDLEISLDLRLLMGRQWSKLLNKNGFDALVNKLYIDNFAIYQPDPNNRNDVYYCANPQSWRKHVAVANRHIDGKKLYDDIIRDSANHVIIIGVDVALHASLILLGKRFVKWFDNLYYQPQNEEVNDAWLPANLEYQFSCSAPKGATEKVYSAKEYYQGYLDWYNFSIDSNTARLDAPEKPAKLPENFNKPVIRSFIPTPVKFDGMPNTRWWAFEEGKTNFGDIKPDTTDINKLLLIEFGLVYANDWYLLPITLPAGSISNIKGMTVRNVFGENLWINATGKGFDDNPNRWTMYSMDIEGTERKAADLSLMIVPAVPKIQQGKPVEEINLVRDEVANMVWGIETRIPLPSGESIPGLEAARDTLNHLKRIIKESGVVSLAEENLPAANLRYKIMSSVPENWIPFISTHEGGSVRETKLQRGSMPRIIEDDPQTLIEKVKPRSSLLREGLGKEPKQSYFINEEEVPRSGVNVTQSFQRTRWYDGRVYNWLGTRKRTGRGEAASQLKFDYLQSVKKTEQE
jgi:hypothetical protein